MNSVLDVQEKIKTLANKEKAVIFQRFFKTGLGEYGEGDIFWGLTVPQVRKIAQEYQDLKFTEVKKLLTSKIHEIRLVAVLILVIQFKEETRRGQKKVYDFYLKSTKRINNWDLVDLSADKIVGAYLFRKPKIILYKLARSKNLWERRIAIIATFYFIKNDKFLETLKIAKILLMDNHDLIHKAVGWMLREVGKKSLLAEENFLKKHYKKMPRTMLRYAIEKFPEPKRQAYLKDLI